MKDSDLFKNLVKRGVLDASLSESILKDAKLVQKLPEDMLYERKVVDEIAMAKAKSEIFGAPYKKINLKSISNDLLKIIPYDTSRTYRVIPIEKTKDMLVVGMLRPDDTRAQEALKFIAKQNRVSLGVYVITPSDLSTIWRRYSPYKGEIETAVKELNLRPDKSEESISLERGGRDEEAPVIKIVATTLRQAVEMMASDIHIEPQRSRLRIRFRVDGKLQEVASLPLVLSQSVVARVKVLSKLKLDETRIPQDGRFRTTVSGRDIDYRVSTFPTPSGEKVAIRVLDPTVGLKGFKELGLSDYNLKILNKAIQSPYGMILISGPTGSGKTTTLYAIMKELNQETVNIVSLEDPVEYFMEGINQSQVKPEIGYNFSSGLRQVLRQDPDIIMVGEIRDDETASLAVNAALTGHIMLSTIHTNNSVGVIPRLIDLKVPTFLLSSALNLMVAQRLVLRLCPECKKEEKAPPNVQEIIQESLETLPESEKKMLKFKEPYMIYRAQPESDCKTCNGKGTSGRIAFYEIFQMTEILSDIISVGFTQSKLWDEARRQGIITLRQDGIIKALEGRISIEEVLKETI